MKRALFLVTALAAVSACSRNEPRGTTVPEPTPALHATNPRPPAFASRREAAAGERFRSHWHDGQAEMNGYEIVTPRYGEPREGELVLIYVTEPHDRRTWIKDDEVTGDDRVEVLKVNISLKFQTGVYPYSILTSVFSPADDFGRRRFDPVKITMTAQEWCGHVFHGVWPSESMFSSRLFSYFASEGEQVREVEVPSGTLYEDALLIQLRELDGPFADGGNFEGTIVPALWHNRRAHEPLEPVDATITRSSAEVDDQTVTRFVLRYSRPCIGSVWCDFERTFDVEQTYPHRILGWRTNDGETARLIQSVRQPYWNLNHNADEPRRSEFLSEAE